MSATKFGRTATWSKYSGVSLDTNCLYDCGQISNDAAHFRIGWGQTGLFENDSPTLLQVVIPIIDQATCQNDYDGVFVVNNTMICAGFEEGGQNACTVSMLRVECLQPYYFMGSGREYDEKTAYYVMTSRAIR